MERLVKLTVLMLLLVLVTSAGAQRSRKPTAKPSSDLEKQQAAADLDRLLADAQEKGRVSPEDAAEAVQVLDRAARALPPEVFPRVRHSDIRMGKIELIDANILTGRADGMMTLDESIKRLLHAGKISRETAESFVTSADRLR